MVKKAAFSLGAVVMLVVGIWFFGTDRGASPEVDVPTANNGGGQPDLSPAFTLSNPKNNAGGLGFADMSGGSGISFEFQGRPTELAYMTEQNGGGVGLLDFDNDGQLDSFFVNGMRHGRPNSELASSNRLYRATGEFKFEDVTRLCGLKAHGHGQGCAAADFDNDGFTDLFVTSYGRDRLWQNNGDGTFSEVTKSAGVGGKDWGTSAAFADLNGDGLTDLYVVNYVDWSPDDPKCHPPGTNEVNFVCSPIDRSGQVDYLYQNMGDGTFQIRPDAGTTIQKTGKGLALAIADLTGDGWLDVYVANDTSPNFLFENRGGMKFEETAVVQGASISSDGSVGAGMGVACNDYDGNGWFDLAVTNFRGQPNDVFSNLGEGSFVPTNDRLGMDPVSRAKLSFGIVFADFNLDTYPELFVANGHIHDWSFSDVQSEYHMHPQVLLNQQGKRFADVSPRAGSYFEQKWLGRAVAIGDVDNDGDPDVVVTHADRPPVLLRNESVQAGSGVTLRLVGTTASREARGTCVRILMGDRVLTTRVRAGTGFQASHDRRVILPRPVNGKLAQVEAVWSGGAIERWTNLAVDDETLVLIQGTGEVVETGMLK